MAITVNNLPSINLPVTNEQGIMHPIWYEFFRAVISNLGSASTGTVASNTVIAGAGIEGTSAVSTVNVGQGDGIVVSADAVSVDINHQVNVQAALEDEILIADASSGSAIKKTSLRDVAALSVAAPGGSNTQIQYNNSGAFGGDSFFTTNAAGTLSFTGTGISLGNDVHFFWPSGSITTYGIGGEGGTPYLQGPDFNYKVLSTNVGWTISAGSGNNIAISSSTGLATYNNLGIKMTGNYIARHTVAGITASTTQTQGQGALTGDINEISTCANANDTVTLPTALAGRHCLVINNGANTLQVFPASGDNLGAGLNTATTIASASRKLFVAFDATNWEPVI